MAKLELSVDAINGRLAAANSGIRLVQRGQRLSLRATLPPRPGSKNKKTHQQYIPLGVYANPAGFKYAEGKALEVAGLLAQGKYEWALMDVSGTGHTCGEWVARFKKDWIEKNISRYENDSDLALYAFHSMYEKIGFNRLPVDAQLNEYVLRKTIKRNWEPNKAVTLRVCRNFAQLAKFAGIDASLKDLYGTYGSASVKRTIPNDEQIIKFIDGMKLRRWQWIAGVMATYGLRDHEAFVCDMEWQEWNGVKHLVAIVPEKTKTGYREVFPLPIEWVSRWNLADVDRPTIQVRQNKEYGSATSSRFRQIKAPFKPYDLRHAYALRAAIDSSLPTAVASKLMGHSPAMNARIYQKHMDEDRMRQSYFDSVNKGK
jgi:integrase